MNIKEKLLKEPRIIMAAIALLSFFLPWVKITASISYFGISNSNSASSSGFNLINDSVFILLLLAVPILVLVLELALDQLRLKRFFYLAAFVISFLGHFIFVAMATSGYKKDLNYGEEVGFKISSHYQIGFWISLAMTIAMLILTLVKDYKVSKKNLNTEGFKSLVKDVKSDIPIKTTETAVNPAPTVNEAVTMTPSESAPADTSYTKETSFDFTPKTAVQETPDSQIPTPVDPPQN